MKAKQRRRLVCGLREVMRSVKTGKAKAVVVSRNIDEGSAKGGLDEKVTGIIEAAEELGMAVLYVTTWSVMR